MEEDLYEHRRVKSSKETKEQSSERKIDNEEDKGRKKKEGIIEKNRRQ